MNNRALNGLIFAEVL